MRFLYILFFLFFLQPATSHSASETCPQISDYNCLIKNSIKVYGEDPEQWWKIYDYTSTKALKCTNIKDVTLFLRLWLGVTDGEMSEGLERDSLKILTKNKPCFFDGVLGMSLKDRSNFIARFIIIDDDEPAYFDALKEAMKNPRYKSIAIKMLNLAKGRKSKG